jgi:hypothetical protein
VQVKVGPRGGSNLCKSDSLKNKDLTKINKLTIIIQFPNFVRSTDLKAGYGKVRYDESTKVCRWEIGTMPTTLSGDKLELTGRVAIHELQVPETGETKSSSSSGIRSPSSSIVSNASSPGSNNEPPVHYSSIPMQVEFSIPKSNVSGLKLSNINITNVKYKGKLILFLDGKGGDL